jgi:hypothetical protein
MSDFMEKQKNELDDFVNKWEDAIKKGLFDAPKIPEVNPQTSSNSFFGFTNTNPSDSPSLTDNEYWKAINSAADDHRNEIISEIINESEHKSSPSNPVSRDSIGCDQKMTPQSLGATYSEEELEELTELKKELYDLESKLMTSMGFGDDKNQKKLESKIESVKEKIHKMSDSMGRAYKNEDQPKQLENI